MTDDELPPGFESPEARAARLRALGGKTIGDELSAVDRDLDDLPDELRALDGKNVTITGRDREKDRLNRADGTISIVPALFAHARRHADDDA
jgi:hypothetical protein